MFSQVSICHFVQGVSMWPLPMMHWDIDTPQILYMGPTPLPIPDMGSTPVPPRYQTWDLLPYYWYLVLIIGDTEPTPHLCSIKDLPLWYWHLVMATKTHTVCMRAVRILLECSLVDFELSKIIEHPLSWSQLCTGVLKGYSMARKS